MAGFIATRHVITADTHSLTWTGLSGDTITAHVDVGAGYKDPITGPATITFTLDKKASTAYSYYVTVNWYITTPGGLDQTYGGLTPSGRELRDANPLTGQWNLANLDHRLRHLKLSVRRNTEATNNQAEATWVPTGHTDDPHPPPPTPPVGGVFADVLGQDVTVADGVPPAQVGAGPAVGPTGDILTDLGDRSAARLVDRDGEWVLEPALPTPGDPVLEIYAASNLVSAHSVLDVDSSDHAQQVRVLYRRAWTQDLDGAGDPPGTVRPDGTVVESWVDVAVMSTPSHGPHTLDHSRTGVPATAALAAQTANTLGARAWLRGRSVEVSCPAAWWVRPRDTVRIRLPGGTDRDLWVAAARHTSADGLSRLTLREFTLEHYPAD